MNVLCLIMCNWITNRHKSPCDEQLFMSEVRKIISLVDADWAIDSSWNKSLGSSLMLMRDATNWPFRGLARQYVSSATHAYSITCFQTFRQARRNFSNPPHLHKIFNSFFQLLSSTCRWLTKKPRCSLPGFSVLHCLSHVRWVEFSPKGFQRGTIVIYLCQSW